ncbi:MAG: hypothetical protein ABWY36_09015 [Leifsonia sp.]
MRGDEPARGVLSHDLDGRWCLTVEDAGGAVLWTVDLAPDIGTEDDAVSAARATVADEGFDFPVVAVLEH